MCACPACGAGPISITEDFMRNIKIFRCENCGDMYAARDEDIYVFGYRSVFEGWEICVSESKKLCEKGD